MRVVLALIVCVAVCSCQWLKTNSKALSADALQTVSCVVTALLSGVPVELVACGALAIDDIVNIADSAHVTPVPSPGLAAVRVKQAALKH